MLCALALGGNALLCAAPASAADLGGIPADTLQLLAIQQTQLTAVADGATYDVFGTSVALSGDTALVGAPFGDGATTNQGAAYVFVRTGATWSPQAKLTANDGAGGDKFGYSVALSGDTALVGAYQDDVGSNTYQGSAYVFVRSGPTWTQQAKLTAADGAAYVYFGQSVALSGETAVVGAPYDDVDANTDQGSAYVFVRSVTTWTQQAKLTAADGAAEDYFGYAVSLAGETALVGAPYDDVGANANQGSAYVFVRSGTSWSPQTQLTVADRDYSGYAVSLAGDTALVGTCVFVRSGTTWTQQAQLTATDGAAGDGFGQSVALSGDTALVGAPYDDVEDNPDQGSASVFVRSGATWRQHTQLFAADGALVDRFGHSVALSGDTALVGAPYDDVGANTDQGSAYIVDLDLTAPATTVGLSPPADAAGWNTSPVTVTLSATDGVSGVSGTFYRLGLSGPFSLITPPSSRL